MAMARKISGKAGELPQKTALVEDEITFVGSAESIESGSFKRKDSGSTCAEPHDEVEEARIRRRNKDPLLYCRLIVEYPRIAFVAALGGHLFMVALNFILLLAGVNMFPTVFANFPLNLRHDDVYRKELAWTFRNNDTMRVERSLLNASTGNFIRGSIVDSFDIYYTSVDKNIFTKDNFQRIKKIEDSIFNLTQYQSRFCQFVSENSKTCAKPVSILRYFDGTHQHISPIFYDPNFDNIPAVLYAANRHEMLHQELQYFLTKKSVLEPNRSFSEATRTSFQMGWPLPPPGSQDDHRFQIEAFLMNTVKPLFMNLKKLYGGDMKIYYYSYIMFAREGPMEVLGDMFLAIGSLIFIFAYMWFQTESFWVTVFAVLSILFSFFSTNFMYRIVLDYQYIGQFHIISVFIILGIGADNIFVFFNTWKATGQHKYKSLAHRMSYCYRRTASTMFFTSLTTMVAFLSNAASPLLPIGSFGVFSGILVGVNYISVIVFFPTVVIMYHYRFENNPDPCSCRTTCPRTRHTDCISPETSKYVVIFFRDYYFKFITHKVVRWIIIGIFLVAVGFFSWATTLLKINSETIKIFKPETNYGRVWSLAEKTFKPATDSDFVSVFIVWGLNKRDVSRCHFTDHLCVGEPVWDDTFDLNSPPAQLALKNFCSKLKTGLSQEQIKRLMIANDTFTNKLQVQCFMDGLEKYMLEEDELIKLVNQSGISLHLPYSEANMLPFMKFYDPLIYNSTSLPNDFYRFFEVGVSFWMNNGYTFLPSKDFILYEQLVGEIREPPFTRPINFASPDTKCRTGCYGTKLRYVALRVNLTLETMNLAYTEGLTIMDNWDNFLNEEFKHMPIQLRGGFQTTQDTWHWLKIQQSLVNNGVFGIVLGICLAFPILVLATQNIFVGLFATLVICCITVCIIGITPLCGWKLGVLVSINFCLVVGLSVDYVVHLAEGYHMSLRKDRMGKVQDTLEALGTSVLSGACTTMGAAIFMLFGDIQFFLQFGVFLFCVIGFSLLFSLVFFTTVMSIIGPEGNFGSLYPMWKCVKNWVIGRKKTDVRCQTCDGKGFHEHKLLLPPSESIMVNTVTHNGELNLPGTSGLVSEDTRL